MALAVLGGLVANTLFGLWWLDPDRGADDRGSCPPRGARCLAWGWLRLRVLLSGRAVALRDEEEALALVTKGRSA
jgi:hypothetical protein